MVNLNHIERIEPNQLTLDNRAIALPAGARRNLMEQLNIGRTL